MNGYLITNGFLSTQKFQELYDMFCESSNKFFLDLKLISNDEILVDIALDNVVTFSEDTLDNKVVYNNQLIDEGLLKKPGFVLFWDKDVKLARYLEKLGYRVFNSARAIEICDDKSLTHLELMNHGIKMPRTIFAPMTYSNIGYTNYNFLNHIKSKLEFPIVIKEVFGSFGKQVYLANDEEELIDLVKEHGNSPLIFQEYVKSSKGRDVRLQVVGERVVASMYRFNDTGDFRANLSNGGKMKGYTPTKAQENLAIKCCKILGLDFAGVDLLFGENDEPIVCEINSNAHFKNITHATGVSVSDEIIKYIVESLNNK